MQRILSSSPVLLKGVQRASVKTALHTIDGAFLDLFNGWNCEIFVASVIRE